jgi:uncharacterized membrane protein YphA (DoxX/SURF4 family)
MLCGMSVPAAAPTEALVTLGSGLRATTAFSVGRIFLGLATLASGVLQLVISDFVRLVPKTPAWVHQPLLAWLVGVVLVVIGLRVLSGRMARAAASVLGVLLLLNLVLLYAPQMVVNPVVDRPFFRGFMWTNPLKSLALVGGAAILARRLRDDGRPLVALVRGFERIESASGVLLAVFLIVCGVQHYVYAAFVDGMVPAWIPPGQRFWTYLTGASLVAGGAGLLVRPVARLAASMSALMIFLWVLMLHIPRALAGPEHAFEAAGIFEALALSGVALLVAATRDPWVRESR